MDPNVLEKVKEQHPGGVELKVKIGGEELSIVVVPPSRIIWRKFKLCIQDERKRPDAFEALVRDCCRWPDAAALDAMLERRPALAETFGDAVAELAGAGLDVEKNG